KLTEFRRLFEERSARDPRSFLVALMGARAAGRLEGLFLSDKLYFVREMRCAEGFSCSVIEHALARFLGDSFSSDGIGILSWDRTKNAEVNAALERAGFLVEKRKAFVARSLKDDLPQSGTRFAFRTLAAAGKTEFLRVMTEAAEGDPFEDPAGRDPEDDFRELTEGAGDRFDPASWMLAQVDGDVVGVVLPQEFPGRDREGTLFYVAVLPPFRGRGYGRGLHAAGLAMLAERGVTRYLGSTDTRNEPMLRVFEANGCSQTGIQLFYKPPSR
ncbi:MAG: GNAT family N-acetyltransferase, partial [Candidatus Eisenbacteria sp.]|nr:GNAT family N-acetyltransferase [Candidatus Eisenbacteria bacterium]